MPPEGVDSVHGGCFLCRHNIEWQQQGREIGYEISVGDRDFYAWTNPFPLLPCHMTIASREHRSQDWHFGHAPGSDASLIINDLLAIASQTVGFIGFYNGVDAGASNPKHFHYQFCARPPEAPEFPLEGMVGRRCNGDGQLLAKGYYPLQVAVWKGTAEEIGVRASRWIEDWADHNWSRLDRLTGNFVVSNDDGTLMLYFVPRDRNKVRINGFSGLIGGLEILGELVLSTEKDKRYLDENRIDFASIERSLARVQTPLYPD